MLTNTFRSSHALLNRKDPTTQPGAKRFIKLGIELFCSVCGTDQTSKWRTNKESTKEDPKPSFPKFGSCFKCYKQQVPPERMCQAFECGKGVSVVKEWLHSQLKETNALWFCRACYHKEKNENAAEKGRKCTSAETCQWHTCEEGGWRCQKCYWEEEGKERRAEARKEKKE